MAITRLDRSTLRKLKDELQVEMRKVADHHGIDIRFGSGSFGFTSATLKVEIATIDDSGEAVTKEVSDFRRLAGRYGLEPEDLGREFVARGVRYRVTGLNTKAHRYPINCESISGNVGKTWKFPVETVKRALANEEVPM